MEKLKSLVPIHLKQAISVTTPDDLPRTCSSLVDFFLSPPHFHQIVGEVTDREMGLCRKNAASALDWKRKGNECFSSGDFINALRFYTQIGRRLFGERMDLPEEVRGLIALDNAGLGSL